MTDIEKVQLKIGTVVSAVYTDAQIQAFLDMEGSVLLAAAAALEAYAAGVLTGTDSERIGDYAYTKKSVDNALKLAALYRKGEAETPVIDWAEMDLGDGSGITAEDD